MEVDLQQAAGRVGAQQKHQHQAQEAGQRDAPRAPQPDKAVVQNQVQHRTGQHRDQRPRAALIDHIDAVQKLVHAGQHRAERQERHKGPCVKILGLEHPHQQLAQHNDARHAAEQHACIHAEYLGEKRLAVGLLGHGRKLPRLIEDAAQNRDDLRQKIPRREQPDPVVAGAAAVVLAQGLHKKHVAGVDDPKADGRRDHRQAVAQHLPPKPAVKPLGLAIPPTAARKKDEHHRGQVRQRVGQQKAGRAHPQNAQEQQVVQQQAERCQHAVYRHQPVQHTGADELGTERAQAACQHTEVEEGQILGRVGDQADQRHGEQQHQKAQPNGGRTVDKDAGLVVFLIKAEPDDRVGHAQTDHRYKQVCGLLQQT